MNIKWKLFFVWHFLTFIIFLSSFPLWTFNMNCDINTWALLSVKCWLGITQHVIPTKQSDWSIRHLEHALQASRLQILFRHRGIIKSVSPDQLLGMSNVSRTNVIWKTFSKLPVKVHKMLCFIPNKRGSWNIMSHIMLHILYLIFKSFKV